MDGLQIGRMVHYVMEDGRYPGEHRPATIVKIWGDPTATPPPMIQLVVFVDGTNDYPSSVIPVVWKTSVRYSETPEPQTWHWIERA